MKRTVRFGVEESFGLTRVLAAYAGMDTRRSIADDMEPYFQLANTHKAAVNFRLMTQDEKKAAGFPLGEDAWRWDTDKKLPFSADLSPTEVEVLQEAIAKYPSYDGRDRWRYEFKKQLTAELPKQEEATKEN